MTAARYRKYRVRGHDAYKIATKAGKAIGDKHVTVQKNDDGTCTIKYNTLTSEGRVIEAFSPLQVEPVCKALDNAVEELTSEREEHKNNLERDSKAIHDFGLKLDEQTAANQDLHTQMHVHTEQLRLLRMQYTKLLKSHTTTRMQIARRPIIARAIGIPVPELVDAPFGLDEEIESEFEE